MYQFPDSWSNDTRNEDFNYGAMAQVMFLRSLSPTKSIAASVECLLSMHVSVYLTFLIWYIQVVKVVKVLKGVCNFVYQL